VGRYSPNFAPPKKRKKFAEGKNEITEAKPQELLCTKTLVKSRNIAVVFRCCRKCLWIDRSFCAKPWRSLKTQVVRPKWRRPEALIDEPLCDQ
jgi:hypothetical protein